MGKADEYIISRIIEEELEELKVTTGFPAGSQLLASITSRIGFVSLSPL